MDARTPELLALDIEVEACAPSRFPHGASFWTYAALLRIIAAVDPVAAAQAHGAPNEHKTALFTVSGILKPGTPPLSTVELAEGERALVRVTAVGERLVFALAGAFAASDRALTLAIGPHHLAVVRARPASIGAPNPGSLHDLREAAADARGPLRLQFVSPTTFERKRLWYAIPSPEQVFGRAGEHPTGLLRHWLILSDSPPGPFSASHVGAVPLRIEPRTARLVLDGGTEWAAPAFLGECEYTAPPSEQHALHMLGLLAQFTGIGQRVAFGMGRVQRLDSIR